VRVNYGGTEFQNIVLRGIETSSVKDPTGYDVTMGKITIDINFAWHPYATASIPPGANLINNNAQPVGDGIGLSIRNLRRQLTQPRQLLQVDLGPDAVWQAPVPIAGLQSLSANGATGPAMCDPGYGPIPELLGLAEVTGERYAIGRWRCTFYVVDGPQILLSNRWQTTHVVNRVGLTTRIIEGWATVRADAVAAGMVRSADDFRKWFIVNCPAGFKRTGCRVRVNEIGTEVFYLATDQECPNPMGADGAGIGAVEFEGEITAGVVSKIKTVGQQIVAGLEVALFGPLTLISQWPTTLSKGRIRVTGGKGAKKQGLMNLALAIASERFFNGNIVSFTVTQPIGESEANGRWIQVEALFLPTFTAWLYSAAAGAITTFGFNALPSVIPKLMNLNNDISPTGWTSASLPVTFPGDVPKDPNTNDPKYQNFNFGPAADSSNNSRGDWLGAIITQSLQTQGQPPQPPPPNPPVMDSPRQ
jgi:hypothetical protein